MKQKLVLILFFLIASMGHAKVSLKKIKDDLNLKSEKVFKLGAKIRSMDKSLGSKNDDYLANLSKVKKIEDVITNLKITVHQNAKKIGQESYKTKKIWQYYLINQQDKQSDDFLLRQKALLGTLERQIKSLKSAEKKSSSLIKTLASYEEQLIDYRQNSQSLYKLILDLENNKKDLSQKYINALDQKNELEEKLEISIAKQKASQRKYQKSLSKLKEIPVKLMLPLRDFTSYKGSKKGMTFKYKKVAPVHATENGKVVYSGELASYGKVIMIDHGHDIRSVLLGDLSIKVKKGDTVTKGQILGNVNSDAGLTKTLYYEVRKKNVAQNTLKLLKKIKTI